MNDIKKVYCVYFSPCGGTRHYVEYIGGKLAEAFQCEMISVDYTRPSGRENSISIPDDALCIWGSPVYAGRLPNKTLPFLESMIDDSGAVAVPVVCYGNRDFGDALMELALILKGRGMTVSGGAALVSRHVFTEKIASERPDSQDLKETDEFISLLINKLSINNNEDIVDRLPGNNPVGPYYIPKGVDGQPAKFLKAQPEVDSKKCSSCGTCSVICPMGTLKKEEGTIPYFEGPCIKCHACINSCPNGALEITDPAFVSHRQMLELNFTTRNTNVFTI